MFFDPCIPLLNEVSRGALTVQSPADPAQTPVQKGAACKMEAL
jgi:hypothetical protein